MCGPDQDDEELLKREKDRRRRKRPGRTEKRFLTLGAASLGLLVVAELLIPASGADAMRWVVIRWRGKYDVGRSTLTSSVRPSWGDCRIHGQRQLRRRSKAVSGDGYSCFGNRFEVTNRAGASKISGWSVTECIAAKSGLSRHSSVSITNLYRRFDRGRTCFERCGILGMAAGLAMMVGPLIGATLLVLRSSDFCGTRILYHNVSRTPSCQG
jgi:hypothetical protein